MGVIQMTKTKAANDPDDPTFMRARAFTVIATLDSCRAQLEKQRKDAKAVFEKELSEKTKEYREILRNEENHGAPQKRRAKFYDELVVLLAERDAINEAKKADMKARGEKISQLLEADAEAKRAGQSGDGAQKALFADDSKIAGMPWATDGTLAVIYAALLDLDQRGATLDQFQQALMMELAEAKIEGADLGLEPEAAIEDDTEVESFESEDDEIDGDEDLSF